MLALAPIDQAVRDDFVRLLNENLSVICPAGSGKTKGISDRLAYAASRPDATALLPTFAVVTFTQKSADEMQERARAQILASKPSPAVLMAFNRAFFGTIHSFAVSLLRTHGHYLGIPSMFEVLEDDEVLWRQFLQQHNGRPSRMDSEIFAALTRIYPFGSLLALVREYDFVRPEPAKSHPMPLPNLGEILAFELPKRANQAANIQSHQRALREWLDGIAKPGDFLPLPSPTTGGEEFLTQISTALAPTRRWMGLAVAEAVHDLALDYRSFRIRKGKLTFIDQVALAAELLRHGRAARELRVKNFRVILDEAQDTDPHQFVFLTELARPVTAGKKRFLETLTEGPRPGHFCMVGDPQQSIYGDRADLGYYLAVHRALLVSNCARELKFQVTFRCDESIVSFANAVCPNILSGRGGQVSYVTLEARPDAASGQVLRLPVEANKGKVTDAGRRDLALESARQLGRWLKNAGLEGLRARSWSEVALLCPRKDWFSALRQGLGEAGLRCQFQSTRDINGDSPAFAWFAGLVASWAEPNNALEIFGVLREVFGLSDHDVAVYVDRKAERLSLAPASGDGPVPAALRLLNECRELFDRLPLREALGLACEKINLHGRLATLPADVYPGLEAEFEVLMLSASAAESDGLTLEEYAHDLRKRFQQQVEAEELGDDALPVITNLKAKGLQWDCVVLPFFGREISFRSMPYPRFLPPGCPVPIAFGAGEIPDEWRNRLAVARTHELERVLYVSLTRPKHTLVLVDDVALWSDADGGPAKNSLARALRVDTDGRSAWEDLGGDACGAAFEVTQSQLGEALAQAEIPAVDAVPEAALKFPERILPHALATHHHRARRIEDPEQAALVHPDQLVASVEDGPAIRYGSWWHELMQALPWSGTSDERAAVFDSYLAFCPDEARGRREIEILRQSRLFGRLTSGRFRVHTEMPFMAPLKGGDSVDGIIDLAAFDLEAETWIVVDWKTNKGAGASDLLAEYRAQLIAYRDCLAALVQRPVAGALYATATGEEVEAA